MYVLNNRDIICISSVDWEPIWTRKQQIMSRLPRSNRILYVEPPISCLSRFKDPSVAFKHDRAREGVRKLNDNTWLLSPPVILPFGSRYPGFNKINQHLIAGSIKKAIGQLGFDKPIVWTYLHTSCDLVDELDRSLTVYDCVDEHSAYDGFNSELVKKMEKKLLAKCDMAFCTAQGLYDDRKNFVKEIHFSPNAADVEHFMKASDPQLTVADELVALEGPVFGFVGFVKEWVDLDLIASVAKAYPQGHVVLVGPIGAGIDMSALKAIPNIMILGHRDRAELPRYIKAFSVCLNVFKLNELTSTVSPLKFYEYLASGVPIASVPMPEISGFSDVVEFGGGTTGFLAAVARALDDNAGKRAARLKRAAENSWQSRADFMAEKISARLKDKGLKGR